MKRLWIFLALGAALVGCTQDSGSGKSAEEGKTTSTETTEPKKDGGSDVKTDTTAKTTEPSKADTGDKSKPPHKTEVIKTTLPDGRQKQVTKDGKSEMVIDPKTGFGVITSVSKDGHKMTIDRSNKVPLSEFELPEYPGSKLPPKEPTVTKITAYGGWEWAIVRQTADDSAKVFAFYKPLLTDPKESGTDPKILTGKTKKGDRVSILVMKPKEGTENRVTVSIRRRDPNVKAPEKPAAPPPPAPGGAKPTMKPGGVPEMKPGTATPLPKKPPTNPGAG